MTSISISKAKDQLTSIIHDVESTHTPVELTRHGKAAVVIMAAEVYQKWSEERPSFTVLMESFTNEYGSVAIKDKDLEDLRPTDPGRGVEL